MQVTHSPKVAGGTLYFVSHASACNNCKMNFAFFLPPAALDRATPTSYLLFLSGLTCTAENFATKAGAFKKAAELGLAILLPDTSPRGDEVADDPNYDLGQAAGFYINATQEPWAKHYQMEDYLIKELLPMAEKEFSLSNENRAISGHSMGGHGALTLFFKYPNLFTSCSAFAPIVAPSQVPWGQKAFSAYLGDDQTEWKKHDASELVKLAPDHLKDKPILIDQGLADDCLEEQLRPAIFENACEKAGQKLMLRQHEGYDHNYYFIQSFIDDHMDFHSESMSPSG